MKLVSTLMSKSVIALLGLTICVITCCPLAAQICSNAGNTVYGITADGEIRPVTISTAVVGSKITPAYTGNAPDQSNGLGYNNLNGKFYFFKRNANSSRQEFVSFDPATNAVTVLASAPTSNTIHTGCASADGLGFYAMDVKARLYYYSVTTNSWKLIATKFFDQYGTNFTSVITDQSSGDIAIDGNGNLWILTSNSSNYGLYKVSAPLPILPASSLNATRVVAPTTTTPTGNSFLGIAFNPGGQIILGTGDDKLYRLENNLSLTFLGNLTVSGIANDLTSCSFPLAVLPVVWESFTAELNNKHNALLGWSVSLQTDNKGYYIEHSRDGMTWEDIGFVHNTGDNTATEKHSFIHVNPANGLHYYRIRQADINGKTSYSATKTVTIKTNSPIAVWPNPTTDAVHIQSENTHTGTMSRAWLFDQSGRILLESPLQPGLNTIAMRSLPSGTYMIRVQAGNGETYNQKLVKQ